MVSPRSCTRAPSRPTKLIHTFSPSVSSSIREPSAGDQVRAYDIVFVVVLFLVVVQGGLVPFVASRLRLPVAVREQEPWALGMRFRDEPHGLHRFTVAAGAPADGSRMDDLTLGENVWVSFVGRDGALVQLRGETRLQAGDEVLVLADPDDAGLVRRLFAAPAS